MEIFKVFVTIIGIGMSVGYFPQAYKIWKLKSSREISLIQYTILGIGTTTWFIYGLLLKDPVIISGFGAGVIGSWGCLIFALYYRNNNL